VTPEEAATIPGRERRMEDYTGDGGACPKCEYPGADTGWMAPLDDLPECLARSCHRCSFTWYERCVTPLNRALKAHEAATLDAAGA
jgi:hypothetical protein